MVKSADLTLDAVRKSPKVAGEASGKTTRLTDFMTKDEKELLWHSNYVGKVKKKQFDEIDAYMAEIMARFGYDAYQAWNRGDITTKRMNALIAAERAREAESKLSLELLINSLVRDCIRWEKGQKKPRGPKLAAKIIKDNVKRAKGVL